MFLRRAQPDHEACPASGVPANWSPDGQVCDRKLTSGLFPLENDIKNMITPSKGGIQTLDGPTKNLFGGKDIPDLWRGKLEVKADWRVP